MHVVADLSSVYISCADITSDSVHRTVYSGKLTLPLTSRRSDYFVLLKM